MGSPSRAGCRTVRFTDSVDDNSFERGERVVVLYDANAPTKARIYTILRFWLLPAILVLIGVTWPVATVLWNRKRERDLRRAAFS